MSHRLIDRYRVSVMHILSDKQHIRAKARRRSVGSPWHTPQHSPLLHAKNTTSCNSDDVPRSGAQPTAAPSYDAQACCLGGLHFGSHWGGCRGSVCVALARCDGAGSGPSACRVRRRAHRGADANPIHVVGIATHTPRRVTHEVPCCCQPNVVSAAARPARGVGHRGGGCIHARQQRV